MPETICDIIRGYQSNYIKIYYDINDLDIQNGIKNGDITELYLYTITNKITYSIGYKITKSNIDTIIELDKNSIIAKEMTSFFSMTGYGQYKKDIIIKEKIIYYHPILKDNNKIIIFCEIHNNIFDKSYKKCPFICDNILKQISNKHNRLFSYNISFVINNMLNHEDFFKDTKFIYYLKLLPNYEFINLYNNLEINIEQTNNKLKNFIKEL